MNDIHRPDAFAPIDRVPVDRALSSEFRENERVVHAIHYLNRTEFSANRQSSYLTFAIDAATRRPIVKVVDRSTKAVLYQIPPPEVLRMAAELRSAERAKPVTHEETASEAVSSPMEGQSYVISLDPEVSGADDLGKRGGP